MIGASLSHDGRSITVRVPMAFAKRGGRKLVISPDGVASVAATRPRIDNTMVKTLARAFWWRKLLETDVIVTVEEIAAEQRRTLDVEHAVGAAGKRDPVGKNE